MLKIQFKAPSGAFFMAAKEAPKIRPILKNQL